MNLYLQTTVKLKYNCQNEIVKSIENLKIIRISNLKIYLSIKLMTTVIK